MEELWRLGRQKSTILKSTYSYKKDEEIYGQEGRNLLLSGCQRCDLHFKQAHQRTASDWRILSIFPETSSD
jgi:hypothetical protein